MKKTMIASATVLALVLTAGMSSAGPLRDHSKRGNADDVRSSVSQTLNQSDRMADTHQATKLADGRFDLSSKHDLGQNNLTSTPQYSANYSKWSSQFPSVVAITISDDGSYTWIFGKTTGSNLSDTVTWMYR